MPESGPPKLSYQPPDPAGTPPGIGLIGCGAITRTHLEAYRAAGYPVRVLCDPDLERARARQEEFYPEADVTADHREVLERDDVSVVDIATHVAVRPPLVRAALRAGKHVLSQKPFVEDLEVGRDLVREADARGVQLAVNQNARWAPHYSYLREAVAAGCLGEVVSADFVVHWSHDWVVRTPFNQLEHLILYDFAIHWFDLVATLFRDREATRVYASRIRSPGQEARDPLLAQAMVELEGGQASLVFQGHDSRLPWDQTSVVGTLASARCFGPSSHEQRLFWSDAEAGAEVVLEGRWFPDGFHGAMGELLCALEEGREASHHARHNLKSLALCFAAVESSRTGRPVRPAEAVRLPPA